MIEKAFFCCFFCFFLCSLSFATCLGWNDRQALCARGACASYHFLWGGQIDGSSSSLSQERERT